MNIPDYAMKIKDTLEKAGYDAYFVGGCVRDHIMGATPHDYDLTTNAKPEEIKKVFTGYDTILTGEKHGTVTVVSDGENIEVTTYRIDGEYLDLRRPESVMFTSDVSLDLARRDFTINAICYNGDFVDPFGGKVDIENKIIRTVGDADARFNEDALRIMRALRFAAVLGFEIEEKTKAAILKNAHLLKNIAVERIFVEFTKLLMGKNAERILLEYYSVIGVFVPEILPCVGFDQKNRYHIYDVYTHIVKALVSAPYNLKIRLAMFFHDIGKPECFSLDEKGGHFTCHAEKSRDIAREVLGRLKVDNDTKQTVVTLVTEHQREIVPAKKYVKRFLSKFSFEIFDLLMEVKLADTLAHSNVAMDNLEIINRLKEIRREIEQDGECVSIKSLAVNGRDIIDAGITDGVRIGQILKALLEKVVDGEVDNDREKLMALAKTL